VSPEQWHVAELLQDGVSPLRLYLDDAFVATNDNVRGPVRSVGPNGIAIGSWPEPTLQYVFRGYR
jgi:hypothetical protein